jgi:hypothetical protein
MASRLYAIAIFTLTGFVGLATGQHSLRSVMDCRQYLQNLHATKNCFFDQRVQVIHDCLYCLAIAITFLASEIFY